MRTLVLAILLAATGSAIADHAVLLIGNSHSSRGGLPDQLATLLRASDADTPVHVETVPRWVFLTDRLDDGITQERLDARPWTHVVLQAQKYSTSGRYSYPTDAAEEWIRRVRSRNAEPILFPEWARRDYPAEAVRIQALHMEIALREPACVAPVGLAWALVLEQHPQMPLYEPDGNHANHRGALLTAYVLYETITGEKADQLPDIDTLKTSTGVQAVLRAAASEAHARLPACSAVSR